MSGSVPGNSSTSRAARTYRPDPPTRMARLPRAWMSAIGSARLLLEVGHAGFLGDVQGVQQVVRHSPALRHRDLGCADVHAAVELHGVGVDDLAVKFQRECHGEVRFPGSGGADHGDDRRRTGVGTARPAAVRHRGVLAVRCGRGHRLAAADGERRHAQGHAALAAGRTGAGAGRRGAAGVRLGPVPGVAGTGPAEAVVLPPMPDRRPGGTPRPR